MRFGAGVCLVLAMNAGGCGDRRHDASGQGSAHLGRGSESIPTPGDPLASLRWDDAPLDWSRPVATAARDLSGFAGSQACRPCHEKISASYAKHSMARTGMRPIESVDQKWLGALFDAGSEVVHGKSGYSYKPSRRGGTYVVTETLLGEGGTPIASWDEPVTHVLSAGSYGLAFYTRRGDRLVHLPIDYYAKAARWDLDPMAFGGNPRINVQLDTFCISCHSDEPAKRYRDPLPGGIGCERCHGPSKKHVETLRPEDTVGVAKLAPRRQLEICAQCHQSTFPVLRDGRDHFDFRPGDALDAFRVSFLADPAEQERVKLLAHAERLVRSACWLGSRDTMTCTTCHDPHTSSLEKDDSWWDGRCMQCHDTTACTDTAEHRATAGDHCVTCHMRSGTTSNVPLVAVTDHWIQTRPAPIRPGPTEKPQKLVAWSGHLGEPVTDDGMAAALALAHADAGLTNDAVRRAVLAIGTHPTAPLYGLVANALLARRRVADAGHAYQAALRLEPDDQSALLGYARVMLDAKTPASLAEAQHAFARLLAIDPDDVAALETLGIHLYRSGDRARAMPLFERAAATKRATAVSYVALAVESRATPAKELAWLELAWRAEPRDRFINDELAAAAAATKNAVQMAEVSRRRTALERVTPDLRATPATAWLPGVNKSR